MFILVRKNTGQQVHTQHWMGLVPLALPKMNYLYTCQHELQSCWQLWQALITPQNT